MTIKLGANLASITAQRRLGESSSALGKVYERLSSGMRINSASDDAAGLAIADSLRADARLYNQAYRNVNDAISLLNVVSSAVGQQTRILTRMSELAEQSANGTFTDDQREVLDLEYQALVDEYGRIADSTEFNGVKVLRADRSDGLSSLLVQVGIDGSSLSTQTINLLDTALFGGVAGFGGDYTGDGDVDGLDFVQYNNFRGTTHSFDELATFAGNTLSSETIIDSNGDEREVYIAPLLLGVFGGDSVRYTVWSEVSPGVYEYVGGDQENPDYQGSFTLTFSDNGATGSIDVDFSALDASSFGVGSNDGPNDPYSVNKTEIGFTGLENVSRSLDALFTTGNLLEALSIANGQIGAEQSRLETASNTLISSEENVVAAESRIRDADIAFETAELVRNQILQQSATAVLEQANQQYGLALELLRI